VILGDTSIAGNLGKKGTSSDITIYDKKINDNIFSFCFANTYPDKLQPLFQSMAVSDYAILNITKLDSFLGEQIIALDMFNMKAGFILYSYEVDEAKIKSIIKNTALATFEIFDNFEQLKDHILNLTFLEKNKQKEKEADAKKPDGSNTDKGNGINSDTKPIDSNDYPKIDIPPSGMNNEVYIPIDHAFDVKGVGTVVLGSIKKGKISVYDELKLYPENKPVMIKSIQMHDDPVGFSQMPARVGLAIKGVTAKEISRGDVISSSGYDKSVISNNIQIKFIKNPYFKEDIAETQNYMVSIGLQIRTVKVKKTAEDKVNVSFEKPIAYVSDSRFILFKPDSKSIRIIGYGYLD
jgi:selenocysteine-specific translation elongation factor